jgi:serine O-acetyltransferase
MPRGPVGRYVATWLNFRLAQRWGCHIDPHAKIGAVLFKHPTGIVIGEKVVVEDEVTIFQGVTLGAAPGGFPVIRRGATIFAGASVLGPVEVGHDAVVAAGAVVLTDVPPYATAVGVPARVIPRNEPDAD